MSAEEIRARARRMPGDVTAERAIRSAIPREQLPPATGTSLAQLPWPRRALARLRFW
jgi:hypothetical protein